MIFMLQYQLDRDRQADTQAFFANMSDDMIEGEFPSGVTKLGRWHDVPNGTGWIVVDASDQKALTNYIMQWSGQCTFPVVTPVVEDDMARTVVKTLTASQS